MLRRVNSHSSHFLKYGVTRSHRENLHLTPNLLPHIETSTIRLNHLAIANNLSIFTTNSSRSTSLLHQTICSMSTDKSVNIKEDDAKETSQGVSILPYREFVLSTLSSNPAPEIREKLLASETDLVTFTHMTCELGEKISFPNPLRFNIPAEVFTSLAQNLIENSEKILDKIAGIPDGSHTFENTLQQFILEDAATAPLEASLYFPSHVSTDRAIRDASNEAKQLLSQYSVEASARVDVYKSIEKFSQTEEAKNLTGERKRYLDYVLRDYRRIGLHLEQSKLDELIELRKEMSSLSIKFQANIGEEDTKFTFTREQLKGLNDNQFSSLTKGENDGDYVVTLKTPDYIPVMQYCSVPETRQILEKAYTSRCISENSVIMKKLVKLRSKIASILGYPSHAAYVLEVRMAKTPERVHDFLMSLNTKLGPLYEKDFESLLKFKKEEFENNGWEFDGILYPYDRSYYARIYEEKSFSIDHEKLKEYFPFEKSFEAMLKLYEHLFSISFEKAPGNPQVWHETVQLYNVIDRAPEANENTILGQFYIDMHPRQGKYSHAAVFPLVRGCEDPVDPSKRILPLCAIVCNFPSSTLEKPSLLSHSNLTTLLHEFGHCLHNMFSKTILGRFSGTSVARDFVEAPSQMLENWCWSKESLELLSNHYASGEKLPDNLLQSLVKSRKALQGNFNKRQLVLGIVDQRLHTMDTSKDFDTAQVYSDTMYDVMHCRPTEGTNMIASFGHLGGGYDASYYGYLWSEVFAADMFISKFAKEGILNPQVGLDYRRKVLQMGDSEDADVLLRNFLGREPNQSAFLTQKGLGQDSS